jgi:GNAT superfamily N-acetyltransferase
MQPLPRGFSVRPVTVDDSEAITGLINDVSTAEVGFPWTTVEETRSDFSDPTRRPEDHDVIVVDAHGVPAAYLQLFMTDDPYDEVLALVYTHPRWWGHGLSGFLLGLGEERARANIDRAPTDARVVFRVSRFATVLAAADLFASRGFSRARTFRMMRIELDDPSPAPAAVEGIRIRRLDPAAETRGVHEVLAEAFADHWGNVLPPFERWRYIAIEAEGAGFDPGLWFVAVDGDELVGAICCRARTARDAGTAEVAILGVRRAHRRRGIGGSLLRAAFGEFRRRGIARAELEVDAESSTGATRLYERAGMHVAYGWEFWEKELRAGVPGGTPRSP